MKQNECHSNLHCKRMLPLGQKWTCFCSSLGGCAHAHQNKGQESYNSLPDDFSNTVTWAVLYNYTGRDCQLLTICSGWAWLHTFGILALRRQRSIGQSSLCNTFWDPPWTLRQWKRKRKEIILQPVERLSPVLNSGITGVRKMYLSLVLDWFNSPWPPICWANRLCKSMNLNTISSKQISS